MPDYKQYTVADYLADESFVNYLLQKNEADTALWQQRREAGALEEETCRQATQLFFALRDQSNTFPVDKAAELTKLQQLIGQDSASTTGQPSVGARPKTRSLRYLWPAAAAAILVIMAATWYFGSTFSGKRTPLKDFVAYATSEASWKEIRLPDGSKVILNGNSSVSLAPGFNRSRREVLLKGTAFFDVAKDPNKPFTVISGRVSTTALGTSFYIHQSSNAAPTTVSLLTGKVRVEVEGQSPIHLVPYEKGIYQPDQALAKSTFLKEDLVNWTRGMVVFNNANWAQVKNIIEEYFDMELIIGKYKMDISFTGAFKADQLEAILSSLEFTYELKYKINNQTVNIAF